MYFLKNRYGSNMTLHLPQPKAPYNFIEIIKMALSKEVRFSLKKNGCL